MLTEAKELKEVEVETPQCRPEIKPLKLSQLIRIGATLRGQAFSQNTGEDGHGKVTTCALMAAYEARFGRAALMRARRTQGFAFFWKALRVRDAPLPCPRCGDDYMLSALIVHWNDRYGWSRERIADELEKKGR